MHLKIDADNYSEEKIAHNIDNRQSRTFRKQTFSYLQKGWIVLLLGIVLLTLSSSAYQTASGAIHQAIPNATEKTYIAKYQSFTGNYDYTIIGNTESVDEFGCLDRGDTNADLEMPADASVVAAYLYWSGSGDITDIQVSLNGEAVDAERTFFEHAGSDRFYGAFADVTDRVTGAGNYEVADLEWDATDSFCSNANSYGGWSLVVVYGDSSIPESEINIYDGFDGYWPNGSLMHFLREMSVPTSCPHRAQLSHVSWEGDAYVEESFYIGNELIGSNTYNGSTAPNLDIDTYDITALVEPGDTAVRITTVNDLYDEGIFKFEWFINNVFVVKTGCSDGSVTPTSEPTATSAVTDIPTATTEPTVVDTATVVAPTDTPAVTNTPVITVTVGSTDTPLPTDTPVIVATDTPIMTVTIEPTDTPLATETPAVTDTPVVTATVTVEATETSVATDTPMVIDTPVVTVTVDPTETLLPTDTPVMTVTVVATETPAATDTPVMTVTVVATETPAATNTPVMTVTVVATETPAATNTPVMTVTVEATETPAATNTPVMTVTVEATETPAATDTPVMTVTVEPTETPLPTETPTPDISVTTVMTITLSGVKAVPGPGDEDGSGTTVLTFDSTQGQICYTFTFENIDAPTAAHIHEGAVGTSGDVIVPLFSDSTDAAQGCVDVDVATINTILADLSSYYVNVHNDEFSAGAIRGQLDGTIIVPTETPVSTDTPVATDTPVPTDTPVETDTPVPTETPTNTPTPAGGTPTEPTIRILDQTVSVGEEFTILLESFNIENLATTTTEITYDNEVLKVTACNKDPDRVFNLIQCNIEFSSNKIRFNITALEGVSGDLRLGEVTFEAIGQNTDISSLTIDLISFADINGTTIPVVIEDGEIDIASVRSGDVNCDANVNSVDALFILQYELGFRHASKKCTVQNPEGRGVSPIYDPVCDVNDDKSCGSIDSLLIMQCDVRIPNRLCPDIANR